MFVVSESSHEEQGKPLENKQFWVNIVVVYFICCYSRYDQLLFYTDLHLNHPR